MNEQKLEQQNIQDTSKLENKENLELERKLDILRNSELKSLFWFDKFLTYLKTQKDTIKLDNVINLFNTQKLKEEVIAYFDIDNENWWIWFFDDNSYNTFRLKFIDTNLDNNKQDVVQEKQDIVQEKQDIVQEKQDIVQEKQDIVQEKQQKVEKEEKTEKSWLEELDNTINILQKHSEKHPLLKNIIAELKEEEDFDKKIIILQNNQKDIFEILFNEAHETWETQDVEDIALNFKNLWVIDNSRYNQIIKEAFEIRESNWKTTTKSVDTTDVLKDYDKKWNTLTKETEKANLTIRDWKMICEWKDSWLKIVDYNNQDDETKAYLQKVELQTKLDKLWVSLGDNEAIIEVLKKMYYLDYNKTKTPITDTNIYSITNEISQINPSLKGVFDTINLNTLENNEEKISQIIQVLYTYTTWNNNSLKAWYDTIEKQIFICNQKAEEKNNTIRDDILKNEKIIQELQKKYPNLDEKTIQDKIKSQETRMQDTVKFCDKFGLSSLGHISFIKRFIQEMINISKKEGDIQVTNDIWTWTEFMSPKYIPIFKKYLARIFGRQEADIFKNWNEGLKEYDGSTNDPDSKLNKNYLENLLKSNKVLKLSWELNTLKLQELIEEWEKVDGMDYM